MKRIIGIMLLTLFTVGLWLPSNASAATSPQIYIQTQRRYGDRDRDRDRDRYRRRMRERAYNRNRNYGYYNNGYYNSGSRLVRQTYWRDGRLHVRYVRVYY